jgi:3-phosphoshikimate 1-carboxyvinyltransferase
VRFEGETVWLGSEDVSDAIRTEQAGMNASKVSVLPAVRTALVALQHSFQRLPGLLADHPLSWVLANVDIYLQDAI